MGPADQLASIILNIFDVFLFAAALTILFVAGSFLLSAIKAAFEWWWSLGCLPRIVSLMLLLLIVSAIAFAIVSGIAYALLGYMVVFAIILIATISCVLQVKNRSKKKEESDESLEDLLVYADKAIERKTAELEAVRKEWCSLDEADRLYDVAMWAVEIGAVSDTDVQRQFSISHDFAKSYVDRLIEIGVLGDDGSRNGKMVALMTEEGVKRLYNLGRM